MITNQNNNILIEEIMKNLISKNSDGIKIIFESLYNFAMKEGIAQFLNANSYESTIERKDYANGYKSKKFKTRMGELDLEIP